MRRHRLERDRVVPLSGAAQPLGAEWPGLERAVSTRTLSAAALKEAVRLGPEALRRYSEPGIAVTDDNQYLAYGWLLRSGADYGPRRNEESNLERIEAARASK